MNVGTGKIRPLGALVVEPTSSRWAVSSTSAVEGKIQAERLNDRMSHIGPALLREGAYPGADLGRRNDANPLGLENRRYVQALFRGQGDLPREAARMRGDGYHGASEQDRRIVSRPRTRTGAACRGARSGTSECRRASDCLVRPRLVAFDRPLRPSRRPFQQQVALVLGGKFRRCRFDRDQADPNVSPFERRNRAIEGDRVPVHDAGHFGAHGAEHAATVGIMQARLGSLRGVLS